MDSKIAKIGKTASNKKRKLTADDKKQKAAKRSKTTANKENEFVSDFDLMMAHKKEMNPRRKKREGVDIINDNDDLIANLICRMRQAAEDDRMLNLERKPATKKLAMLKVVQTNLIKKDLQWQFLEQNVLNVLTAWLAPLPNNCLPSLTIRESVLKMLANFPTFDSSFLKDSGIGKAVMFIYRHPMETKFNRELAGRLIADWTRSIHGVTDNFKATTREERQQHDVETSQMKKYQEPAAKQQKKVFTLIGDDDESIDENRTNTKRAKVPVPSDKLYLIRPENTNDIDMNKQTKKAGCYGNNIQKLIDIKQRMKGKKVAKVFPAIKC